MAYVNQETKNKLENISTNMKNYAVLLDEPIDKTAEGMGMKREATVFSGNAEDVKNGVFKVLVMGKFKNGKSTFINAIVGKVMMAARATACTAVIATVEYGTDMDNVKVIYSDGTAPINMTLEKFAETFALSDADQQYIEEGGRLDRFANVSHVEMQSKDEMFADGLKLIDSPGLEEATARTKATNEFVPKANAIIFTLSAVSLFSAAEKEYIAENFAGKNMRNVFFVINRIDNLTEGELESSVIPTVRKGLESVFKDKNGNFDENLYSKRVFFTNAYGALRVRTGNPCKFIDENEEVKYMTIEDTGISEFEVALSDFLNSSDRINATFNSTIQNMVNTYQIAVKNAADEKTIRSLTKEQRKKNAELAENSFKAAEAEVENIKKTINDVATTIAKKVYLDLCSYIQNDIPNQFKCSVTKETSEIKFGVTKMIGMATSMISKNDEKVEGIYKPFMDCIESYIKTKLADWSLRIPTLIDQDLRDLTTTLNTNFSDFDMSLEKATNLFVYGNAKAPKASGMDLKTGLQNIIALSNWDVSFVVENTAEGGMGWMDFAKRAATQLGLDMAVTLIFGAPFLAIALPLEVVSMMVRANKMKEQLLEQVGASAFKALADRVKDLEVDFKENVVSGYVKKGEEIATIATDLMNEQKAKMEKLVNENALDDEEAKCENARVDRTLSKMKECINNIYKELYGRVLTEDEFLSLAKNEKKK